MRSGGRGWEQAAEPPRWRADEECSGVVGPRRPGWSENPQSGCAAGAGSAGSAADGPSSRRT